MDCWFYLLPIRVKGKTNQSLPIRVLPIRDYTLIAFHELNKNFLMQVGLEKLSFKLFHSDLNLIITV